MPTEIGRYKQTLTERSGRALKNPKAFLHYYGRIRLASPTMTRLTAARLAWLHVHNWVWNNIDYDDIYIPRTDHDED